MCLHPLGLMIPLFLKFRQILSVYCQLMVTFLQAVIKYLFSFNSVDEALDLKLRPLPFFNLVLP